MLPFPIKPMLLSSAKEPFDSSDYIFEWKVDGIRCIMFYKHGKVRLQSKTGKDCTAAFPELLTPPMNTEEAVFDGEITVFNNGKPDFESVMERYLASPKIIIQIAAKKQATYIVWDILWFDGKQLTHLPLIERKKILDQTLNNTDFIRKMDWVDGEGLVLWEAIKFHGLEGMVSKKKNSQYIFRRSPAWLKIKNYQQAVVNVFGYSKKDHSVLVGTGDKVQGHAIGMHETDRKILCELLDNYGQEKGLNIYLPPGIQGIVKFTTWTPKGNMRDCSWVRIQGSCNVNTNYHL